MYRSAPRNSLSTRVIHKPEGAICHLSEMFGGDDDHKNRLHAFRIPFITTVSKLGKTRRLFSNKLMAYAIQLICRLLTDGFRGISYMVSAYCPCKHGQLRIFAWHTL
jgi:hypothetical protein